MISLVAIRTKFTSVFGSTSGLNTWFTGTMLKTDVVYEQTMIATFLLYSNQLPFKHNWTKKIGCEYAFTNLH